MKKKNLGLIVFLSSLGVLTVIALILCGAFFWGITPSHSETSNVVRYYVNDSEVFEQKNYKKAHKFEPVSYDCDGCSLNTGWFLINGNEVVKIDESYVVEESINVYAFYGNSEKEIFNAMLNLTKIYHGWRKELVGGITTTNIENGIWLSSPYKVESSEYLMFDVTNVLNKDNQSTVCFQIVDFMADFTAIKVLYVNDYAGMIPYGHYDEVQDECEAYALLLPDGKVSFSNPNETLLNASKYIENIFQNLEYYMHSVWWTKEIFNLL